MEAPDIVIQHTLGWRRLEAQRLMRTAHILEAFGGSQPLLICGSCGAPELQWVGDLAATATAHGACQRFGWLCKRSEHESARDRPRAAGEQRIRWQEVQVAICKAEEV